MIIRIKSLFAKAEEYAQVNPEFEMPTMEDFEEITGVKRNQLYKQMNGKTKHFNTDVGNKLLQYFHDSGIPVDIRDVIDWVPDSVPQ